MNKFILLFFQSPAPPPRYVLLPWNNDRWPRQDAALGIKSALGGFLDLHSHSHCLGMRPHHGCTVTTTTNRHVFATKICACSDNAPITLELM